MNNDYKKECWKRYLENQKYEKYDKEDLVDEIMELQQENQQLKKQKDDVVEYIKKNLIVGSILDGEKTYVLNDYTFDYKDLLRMLGEIE